MFFGISGPKYVRSTVLQLLFTRWVNQRSEWKTVALEATPRIGGLITGGGAFVGCKYALSGVEGFGDSKCLEFDADCLGVARAHFGCATSGFLVILGEFDKRFIESMSRSMMPDCVEHPVSVH